VSDEWGLRAGVYRFGGDSDLKFTMEGPALGSEFGLNPHVVFVGARYYF
jgi:outer membrane protein W